MSPWFDGLCLVLARLLVIVTVSGLGQRQDGCGRCWIESHPEEQCNITGTDKITPLPRSLCYVTAPKLKVKVVPVKGCQGLTFNVSIALPDEGTECLTGFRLSITHYKTQDFLFAYDIKLSNGTWSHFGKKMVLQFQIPDSERTTCVPTFSEGYEYFFKLQPVPGKSTLTRSISEDAFVYTTVALPKWKPGEWETAVKHEVLADGVQAWFEVPPEPECFCLRKFKLMLVSNETNLALGEPITVYYPHNEGFFNFSKIKKGTYQICVRAFGEKGECKSTCRRSCTDWFTYPKALATPPTTTTSSGSEVQTVTNKKPEPRPFPIGPIAGGAAAGTVAGVLFLVGAVIAYKRAKKSYPSPDTETKQIVAVLYHGSRMRDALQLLESLLEMGNRFVCRQINLSDLQNSFPDYVINMSAVILIVCSEQTADDFLETPSWPSDDAHQRMLSLIRVRSNQRKQVLVKWNPEWNQNRETNLLDWMKFPGGTKSLTCDTNGSEFMNAITDVVAVSNYEWPSMSTLRPDEAEMGQLLPSSSGKLHPLDPNDEMMSGMMSAQWNSDPLLPRLNT